MTTTKGLISHLTSISSMDGRGHSKAFTDMGWVLCCLIDVELREAGIPYRI